MSSIYPKKEFRIKITEFKEDVNFLNQKPVVQTLDHRYQILDWREGNARN